LGGLGSVSCPVIAMWAGAYFGSLLRGHDRATASYGRGTDDLKSTMQSASSGCFLVVLAALPPPRAA